MSNPLNVRQTFPPPAFGGHGVVWAPVSITDGDSPYSVLPDDVVVYADSTGAAVTVALPPVASSTGRVLAIKATGSANTVTVDPDGTEQIEGAATLALAAATNVGVTIHCDGAAWWVLGGYP